MNEKAISKLCARFIRIFENEEPLSLPNAAGWPISYQFTQGKAVYGPFARVW